METNEGGYSRILEGPTLPNDRVTPSNATEMKNSSSKGTKRAASSSAAGSSKRIKATKSQKKNTTGRSAALVKMHCPKTDRKRWIPEPDVSGVVGRDLKEMPRNESSIGKLEAPVDVWQTMIKSESEEETENDTDPLALSEQNNCHLPVKSTQTLRDEADELVIKEEPLVFAERCDEQLQDECKMEVDVYTLQECPNDFYEDKSSEYVEPTYSDVLNNQRNQEEVMMMASQEPELRWSAPANTSSVGPNDDTEVPSNGSSFRPMTRDQKQLILRGQIVALHESGFSLRVIAQRLGTSVTTVCKWIKRHKETGNLTDLERASRPRLTTREEDDKIRQLVEENPFMNAVAIRNNLKLNVTTHTVRRRLYEMGLHHSYPVKKERRREKHRSGRLTSLRQYVAEDSEFWSKEVFTDEKAFTSNNHGRIHLWKFSNTRDGGASTKKDSGDKAE